MKKSCCLGLLIAWVMWVHYIGERSEWWVPQAGYDTRAQCLVSLKEEGNLWRDSKSVAAEVTLRLDQLLVTPKDGALRTYLCLPDTVDPCPKDKQ